MQLPQPASPVWLWPWRAVARRCRRSTAGENTTRPCTHPIKDPTKVTELFNTLEAVVKGAGATHAPVAPGIYAEFGYLLLQQGKASEATQAFQQEKQHWPESAVFMDRMIKVATQNPAATPAKSQ